MEYVSMVIWSLGTYMAKKLNDCRFRFRRLKRKGTWKTEIFCNWTIRTLIFGSCCSEEDLIYIPSWLNVLCCRVSKTRTQSVNHTMKCKISKFTMTSYSFPLILPYLGWTMPSFCEHKIYITELKFNKNSHNLTQDVTIKH